MQKIVRVSDFQLKMWTQANSYAYRIASYAVYEDRYYLAEILPKRRVAPNNQSIYGKLQAMLNKNNAYVLRI